MKLASQWVQMTLVALVVYLIVTNAEGAAKVIGAGGNSYATAVRSFTRPASNVAVGNAARR